MGQGGSIEATVLEALRALRDGRYYDARELLQEAKREATKLAVQRA